MHYLKYCAAVLVLAATTVSAQPPGGPRGGPDIERLTILLDLDAYQKGEVERILREQRDQMIATRKERAASDERPAFEEMRARREQNEQALLAKLQTVLTDVQITKFKVLMDQPRGHGPRGDGPRGRPPVGE